MSGRKAGSKNGVTIHSARVAHFTLDDVMKCGTDIQEDIFRHLAQAEQEGCSNPLKTALHRWRREIGALEQGGKGYGRKKNMGPRVLTADGEEYLGTVLV